MQTVSSSQSKLITMSDKHAAAGIRWIKRMRSDEWNLSVNEACELLGGVPKHTYLSWESKAEKNEQLSLDRDVMERLSLLLGIYNGLKSIAPNRKATVAYEWFHAPNENMIFSGRSIKQYLIDTGSMEALYQVRDYIDNARG